MKVLWFDNSTALSSLDDLKRTGRGGMVSSLLILPDVLSKLNIESHVWADIGQRETTEAGVTWYPQGEASFEHLVSQKWDVIVFNRCTHNGFPEFTSRHRVLWTHDCPHGGWIPEPKTVRAFSATVFMSRYSERVWRYYYPDIGRSFQIPNGVDKERFKPGDKDLSMLIFASAPNRGLSRMAMFFEALRHKCGDRIRMKVFSSLKMHPHELDSGHDDLYGASYRDIEDIGIEYCGTVPQAQLAEELGRASLMLLPTGYPEQCSNSILQALQSGCPVITTGSMGSACEWVRHRWNGMLTEFHLEDYMAFHKNFFNLAHEVLTNERLHRRLIDNGPHTPGLFTWKEIGDKWSRMLKRL